MSTTATAAAIEFFAAHAPFCYRPAVETREQGRARVARELADAEAWAAEQGYAVTWEHDTDAAADHEHADDVRTCECAFLWDATGELLAALGCIDDADDNYRRVIAAELADEARACA